MKTIALTTRQRLGLAFGVILGLFAVALLVVLSSLHRMAEAEAEVDRLERAKEAGHRAASLIREQYIHQAHTIINWNRSHLEHYADVARQALEATARLEEFAQTSEEGAMAREISARTHRGDEEFRQLTLPAIDAGNRALVRDLHMTMERSVGDVLRLNRLSSDRFEQRTVDARTHAATLRTHTRVSALVCFGLASIIAAAVGIGITRSIAGRVAALRDGVRRLGEGDLSVRIATVQSDEFAELARAFNDMAADLHQHQEQLVRSLKLASIGQVAAGVAHEINNPLGVILGYVRLMRRGDADAYEEGLRVIEEETVQCQRIVRDLLELARPPRLALARVDIGELARESLERLRASGKLDGLEVLSPATASGPVVLADEARLRQVMISLLMNAVEATPASGSIALDVQREPEGVILSVEDSGPGIDAAIRSRIFDPFFTTKANGTGLGLALAYAAVEAHDGRIYFERSKYGGARAVVVIPAAHDTMSGT